jgi:hypothetical protein
MHRIRYWISKTLDSEAAGIHCKGFRVRPASPTNFQEIYESPGGHEVLMTVV